MKFKISLFLTYALFSAHIHTSFQIDGVEDDDLQNVCHWPYINPIFPKPAAPQADNLEDYIFQLDEDIPTTNLRTKSPECMFDAQGNIVAKPPKSPKITQNPSNLSFNDSSIGEPSSTPSAPCTPLKKSSTVTDSNQNFPIPAECLLVFKAARERNRKY